MALLSSYMFVALLIPPLQKWLFEKDGEYCERCFTRAARLVEIVELDSDTGFYAAPSLEGKFATDTFPPASGA